MVRVICKEYTDKISIRSRYSLYDLYQFLVKLGQNFVGFIVFPMIIMIVFYIGIFSIPENFVFGLAFLNTGLSMLLGYLGGVRTMLVPIFLELPPSIDLYYHNWLLVCDDNEYLTNNFRDVDVYVSYDQNSKQYEVVLRLHNEKTEQTVHILTHTSHTYKWVFSTANYISVNMDLGTRFSTSVQNPQEIYRDPRIAREKFAETKEKLMVSLLEGTFISKIGGILLVLVVFSLILLPILYLIARIFLFYTQSLVAWII